MQAVIGYIRVSTKGQEDGTSLDEQARLIEEWCRARGYNLTAIYREVKTAESVSGRPTLQAALAHIFDDGPDGLVVLNFDRFSRETADATYWRRQFQTEGKLLLSVQEESMTGLDEDDPFSHVPFEVRMVFAKAERKMIKKRLLGGKRAAGARGSWTGGQIPFGFQVELDRDTRIKRLVPSPAEQASIAKIRELEAQGMSSRQIAGWLTQINIKEGLPYPYPTARGHARHTNVAVWRIMRGAKKRAG